MAEQDPGDDPVEKALRLFVYGPIGMAAYLMDSAPTLLEVFVSRGRREVDGAKRAVERKLGMNPPEPPPAPSVPRRVTDGLGKVAAQAGNMGFAVAGMVVNAATGGGAPAGEAPAADTSGGAPTDAAAEQAGLIPPNGTPRGSSARPGPDLAIAGYDQLSASQVIERLDGLSRGALERIRAYELAHRARRTILASIDQLTI